MNNQPSKLSLDLLTSYWNQNIVKIPVEPEYQHGEKVFDSMIKILVK